MSDLDERARLHHEIEQTREELGETVAALAGKADVKGRAGRSLGEAKAKAATQARMLKDKAVEVAGELKDKAGERAGDMKEQVMTRTQSAREQVAGKAGEVKEQIAAKTGQSGEPGGDAEAGTVSQAVDRTRAGATAAWSKVPEGLKARLQALVGKAKRNPKTTAGAAAAVTGAVLYRRRGGARS